MYHNCSQFSERFVHCILVSHNRFNPGLQGLIEKCRAVEIAEKIREEQQDGDEVSMTTVIKIFFFFVSHGCEHNLICYSNNFFKIAWLCKEKTEKLLL